MNIAYTQAPPPDFDALIAAAMFPIPCARCGGEFTQTIAWLQANYHVRCPNCKETITFDSNVLWDGVARIADVLERFWRSVGYIL
jgi:hypothetical protein